MKTIFQETQKFRQWWLWVLLLAVCLLPFIEIVKPFIINDAENIAKVDLIMITTLLVPILLVVLIFYFLKLKTKITSEGIEMQYTSLLKKRFSWQEIESAEIIDYGFVGGWGIRMWTKYGTIYNVAGSKGLQIKLKNEKPIVIGSQKIEELEKTLKEINLGLKEKFLLRQE